MCTALTLNSLDGGSYFGRTMDFSYEIQPHFYVVPKNYKWMNNVTGETMTDVNSFIGIGQQIGDLLGFFDGVNEYGFSAAALYFAGYASYNGVMKNPDDVQLAAYDFLHYILANCKSVEELCVQIEQVHIVGIEDPVTRTVAPLHWIASDRSGRCVVVEQTDKGMEVFNNSMGVLANSPDFRWHMTNLNNYTQVTPNQEEEAFWGKNRLTPFGQAGGTVPLPGGFTSPERFVRTSYLKTHLPIAPNAQKAVISFFQVTKSVSIPKGAVLTARDTDDYTQYSAFIDNCKCEYYFNTYDNLQIRKVSLSVPGANTVTLLDLGNIQQPMIYESL